MTGARAWRRAVCAGILLLAAAGCTDDDDDGSSRTADRTAIPEAPAACAGLPREGLEDVYLYGWAAARAELGVDPGARVWIGLSRVLSPVEVGDLLAPLTVHGLVLVYEQQQGTYVKVQSETPDLPADDPALAEEARTLVGAFERPPVTLPGIEPDALDPVDPEANEAAPPIAVLLVSGDVTGLLEREPCLVHSMSPGAVDAPAQISPAIEPDPVRIDPEGR